MIVAAAIIAGGRATRMGDTGAAKGLLIVEGRRIIDRQLEVLRPLFSEIIVVANEAPPWRALGLRVVPDRVFGGIGPLAGIDAALAALPDDDTTAVVCVAGDMPFLNPAVLTLLRDAAPAALAVAPRLNGRPEPLLARYSRAAAPIVRDQIAHRSYALTDLLSLLSPHWLEELQLRTLDPDLRSIQNINTPADLARLTPDPPP
jgi:molybdopterin-guanine dinucleotide biosynthesis protein A